MLFPVPERPMMTRDSPRSICKSTPSSTALSPKHLVSDSMRITPPPARGWSASGGKRQEEKWSLRKQAESNTMPRPSACAE